MTYQLFFHNLYTILLFDDPCTFVLCQYVDVIPKSHRCFDPFKIPFVTSRAFVFVARKVTVGTPRGTRQYEH